MLLKFGFTLKMTVTLFIVCCLFAASMGDTSSSQCLNDKDPLQALQSHNLMTFVIQSCQQILNNYGNESRTMETMEREIGKMEHNLKAKDQEIEQLKVEFKQMKAILEDVLKLKLSNLDEKMSNIEINFNSILQVMKAEIMDDIKGQDMKISTLMSEMSTATDKIAQLKDNLTHGVSFSSYKKNIMNDSHIGVPVVFEGVRDNFGNAYNPSTGIFTAPLNGTYFFYVSILSRNTYAEYALYKEGATILNILSDRTSGNDVGYDEASGSVVIHLDKGNKVCVKPTFPSGGKFYAHHNWSNFIGFLVHRE